MRSSPIPRLRTRSTPQPPDFSFSDDFTRRQRGEQVSTPQRDRGNPPWLQLLSKDEQAEFRAVRRDAIEYIKQGFSNPERRTAYMAEPDSMGQRARTLKRLNAAWNAYSRLGRLGRQRLQRVEQGLPLKREPPWLPHLSATERAAFVAAWRDAIDYIQQGLANPQRRAAYNAVPDATGLRERTMKQLQTAWNTYSRLARIGRKRMQRAQHGLPTEQGPAALKFLGGSERAEFDAAWQDAKEFKRLGLSNRQRRDEYWAAEDPTGERAQTFERLQAAHRTYA